MFHYVLSDYILAVCILIYLIYTFANCYVVVYLFPSGFHMKLFSLLMLNNNPLPLIAIVCYFNDIYIILYYYKFPIVILGFSYLCCSKFLHVVLCVLFKVLMYCSHASLLICKIKENNEKIRLYLITFQIWWHF